MVEKSDSKQAKVTESQKKKTTSQTKPLPNGIAYMNATGLLERILQKLIEAPEPDRLTHDYLENVWGFSGGSARAAVPFLKKAGLLSSDGAPTEVYSEFRSETSRGSAAVKALRQAFSALYRVSDHLERASDVKLLDVVVQVTGRGKDDQIVRAVAGSFKALAVHAKNAHTTPENPDPDDAAVAGKLDIPIASGGGGLGLSYQINVILPESKDIEVYDAIFKSLKANML